MMRTPLSLKFVPVSTSSSPTLAASIGAPFFR
jgi:hypothetical protein